jgi:endo-1,4-beta-xylanase
MKRIGACLVALATACAGARTAADPTAGSARWKAGDTIPSLAEAYRGQFLVGAAVTPGMVIVGNTRGFLERQYNVVVTENEMKPLSLTKREGEYDFSAVDPVVDWANQKGIKVRGHCLVWHQQQAPWMFTKDGKPVSRDLLVARLRTYIHEVVGHFKGRVWAWDVVNEAFVDGEPNVASVNGWRRSDWYEIIGPDYIGLAFQFAHEADPDALLFYNDYSTENPRKRALILELVRSLRARGVPIHGVGHQSHHHLDTPDPAALEVTIREVAGLGLRNHITELDISLRPRWGEPVPVVNDRVQAEHARRYAEFFRMFRRNRDKIEAVLTWGVNDESSWLRVPDEPLLFSEWEPKPEFWAVLDEARGPPR